MNRMMVGVLLTLLVTCAVLGGLLWHERGRTGAEDCELRSAARANVDTQATAEAQHRADSERMAQLQAQIAGLQADAEAATRLRLSLQTRLAEQNEVLKHVHDTDVEARRCLDAGVPRDLLDSLHDHAAGATDASGGSGPL